MTKELVLLIIELVVAIAGFLIGRYILPKYSTTIKNASTHFEVLLKYAESFCSYARQFLKDQSGSEKMDVVVEKLKAICDEQGIKFDEETLKAIAQKAYDAMVAGENSAKIIIETPTEERLSSVIAIDDNTVQVIESKEDEVCEPPINLENYTDTLKPVNGIKLDIESEEINLGTNTKLESIEIDNLDTSKISL